MTAKSTEKILAILKMNPKVMQALVYGSRAKGNYKPGSDIDLVLVGPGLTTTDLLKLETDLEEALIPYQIDLSLLHQIEDPELLDHIQRVGKVLFKRK
ncbi:MAG: nucleotidyltransferase domain-containing protein [Oligoflexia bacterium]|nr:nucleotidyltransferase domain-containing protein [Oligoflexia bacterium]